MKILVAGGAGYVGSALVPKLVERGYDVMVVDLLWFGNNLPSGVPVVCKDLMEINPEELEGVDQVVFLGGLSNDPMAEYSPRKNFVSNAAAPAYLAYAAKRAGVRRFIYGGSCSVYGRAADEPCDEEAPAASRDPYGISKLQGESAARQLQSESFSVIALRKGTVCGFSPRMRFDLVVNTMFKTALADGVVTVNNPAIWRPILAVQDAVSAYLRAVECGSGVSGIFNVASGNYTLGQIGNDVLSSLKRHMRIEPQLVTRRDPGVRNYKVNFDRARRALGFKPRYDVAAIVEELCAHRGRFGDFADERYSNIDTFKRLDGTPREPVLAGGAAA